jgi:hypothetical protein
MPSGGVSVAYHRTVNWARFGGLLRDDGPMGRSLAAVVLAVAWVGTWRPQVDPDAWWHIAIGTSITETGRIPAVEPFSWLTAGERFVAHSWLWDVLMAGAWRAAGATGTSLLVLPVTALVVWLLWRLIRLTAPAVAPLPRAALVLIAVIVVFPLWAPRAQTLDVAFVLASVLVLARYLRRGALGSLVALPVIGLLWANLHGSAVLGLAASVAVAVVALPVGLRWGSWPRRPVWPLAAAGLGGIAAAAVNPYGPALLLYPFDRDVASAFSPAIAEWGPPDFGAPGLAPFGLLLVVVVLMTALRRPGGSRDPFLLLSAAAWTFAALGSVRFLEIAGPLLVVALAPALEGTAKISPDGPDARPTVIGSERPAAAIAAVAIAAVLAAGWLIIDPARQDAAIGRRQPIAAVAALDAAGCTARLLPSYNWAGYVAWATGRQVGAYGNSAERAVEEQAALEAVAVDPAHWLDRHAVGAVLMPLDGPLSHWLDEANGWRLAYRDGQATVHVRAEAEDCPLSSPATP